MVRLSVLCSAAFACLGLADPLIKRASLQQVTNSGISNPTNVGFYIYVPNKLAANPAIVVAIHYCSGTAQAFYTGTPYASLAEQYGYIVIYPSSPNSGTCWDVSSRKSLTRNGGGDSNGIANMVKWTITKYNADASRVFAVGTSSGAMMTNVMAAAYPDMFKAGIAYAGVPAGCFVSAAGGVAAWNSTCAQGNSINTPASWANVVKNIAPGYTGPRPKMQIHHGSADTTIYPNNFNETIKQWAGVFGYDYTKPRTEVNAPERNYYRYTYGDNLQGVWGIGVTHNIPIQGTEDMKWFGFTGNNNPPTSTTTSQGPTSTPGPSQTPSPTSVPGSVPHWGQCGGIGYTGPTSCESPYACVKQNDWYSQCL